MRIAQLLKSTDYDSQVVVKGWVRTKRGNKNVAFIALNDGSCVANIQIVVDLAKADEDILRQITTGACICVEGQLVKSLGQGQGVEVQAEKIEIYGTADPVNRDLRHSRSRELSSAEEGPLARVLARHRLSASPHQHLRSNPAHPPRYGICHSQIFQRPWFLLSAHPAHHRFRL